MLWLILASLLIGFGFFAYYNSKKQRTVMHLEINGNHIHDKNSHEHNHKSGHGCCK